MRWRCNLAVYIVEISTSEIKTLTDAVLAGSRARGFVWLQVCHLIRPVAAGPSKGIRHERSILET